MNLATTFQDNVKPRLEKSIPWLLAGALAFSAATTSMNANAETQQVNHSPAQTQQTEPDDHSDDAANYAKEHNTVAIWVCAPMDLGKTPQEIARMFERIFKQRGIDDVKAYSTVSTRGGNRVAVYVGNELYRDPSTGNENFDFGSIKPQINQIIADTKRDGG